MSPRQLRRAFFALTAALVVASLAGLLPRECRRRARLEAATPPERGAQAGPNFVVIMVDDQALNTFTPEVMPQSRKAEAMALRMESLADCNGIEGRDEPSVPFCE
jgi:hypothetical protein